MYVDKSHTNKLILSLSWKMSVSSIKISDEENITEKNIRVPDEKEPSLIISDLKEKGKIVWQPTEDIEKFEVKPSDYVEEKLGMKSIKNVAGTFYKELKKHGMIYFLISVPFLQLCLG